MKTRAVVPKFDKLVEGLRTTFASGRTRSIEWRKRQLDALHRMLREGEQEIVAALAADLGRSGFEGWLGDVRSSQRDIEHTRRHFESWAQPETVSPPWQLFAVGTKVLREPLGVVLVMAPWNYPVYLLVTPLAAAIAAGNAVVCKPSELTPTVSATLARLFPKYLDSDAITLVEGGAPVAESLLNERFDHILYTGGPNVARIVMTAAAKHLTPVTLELGGKSPAIVDATASIGVAAGRIAWGKFINCGQTCIAPDYVLVERSVEKPLLDALTATISARYGNDPSASPDLGRIVNERHFDRLVGLLDGGGYQSIACGGQRDRAKRYIAPTVLAGVDPGAPIMSEEIFGPILPVIPVDSVDDAIRFVNEREKPLALYMFSNSSKASQRVLTSTSSGGACINDAVTHVFVDELPFGGVGQSGMGAYHGRTGFETFSHRKSVLSRPTWLEMPMLMPPYTSWKQKLTRFFF